MSKDPRHGISRLHVFEVGAVLATGVGLAAAGVWSLLRASQKRVDTERQALERSTASLRKRNEQLTALYNVFSEITETLTLRYVVGTTMREAIKIMGADMVVLRKREGNQLIPVGALAANGIEIKNIAVVEMDEDGPTGRAARKGQCVRIEENGELLMGRRANTSAPTSPSSQTGRPPLESGIITPLIVGSRVVGTLSCWSVSKSAFDSDDERILEMMSSSVATAIVAAEAVTISEGHAHRDPLTELPNRRQLADDLETELSQLVAQRRSAIIAMVDIDHFKDFNDKFGHNVGDLTLQNVAAVLRKAMRDDDMVYRYGGEEFVIIFKDATGREAMMLAERVRKAVENAKFGEDEMPVGSVTISVGLALLPEHGDNVSDLIVLADAAMYESKKNGRNQTTIWSPTRDRNEKAAA